MKKPFPKWTLYAGLAVLYLLHNDLWYWDDSSLVLGLPVGLLYHIGFCVAASVMMMLLVNNAWPRYLKAKNPEERQS
jgi:hypothetical protein